MQNSTGAIIVVGLAGSGKSTLMNQINQYVYDNSINSYFVNLDPATADINFSANVDIRDTVKYDEVMQQFQLGPNGAILTSLNLFSTKFHEVINLIQTKEQLKYAFFDTPGQIEAFAWSASGGMITQELSTAFPTVLVFVVDIPRCSKTPTFISTMLYACSILYRSGLPMVLALTKSDVKSADEIIGWMTDLDKFDEAIDSEPDRTYFSNFNRSTGLVFSEFYNSLPVVPVSGKTGEGIKELLNSIDKLLLEKIENKN